jgi:hypothetical protein
MAFAPDEVGLERGATKLTLDRAPRIADRYQEGGPLRAAATSLEATPMTTEWVTSENRRELVLILEKLTEAQTSTLRDLLDSIGPVTVKTDPNSTNTVTAVFRPGHRIDAVVGDYPDNAPSSIRYHRAVIPLHLEA